jgi:hypothetical protein
VGCERVRGAKQRVGSCRQTRDKGGLVFVTTSKETGSPSKQSGVVLLIMQGVGLVGNAVHFVNIAMNDLEI